MEKRPDGREKKGKQFKLQQDMIKKISSASGVSEKNVLKVLKLFFKWCFMEVRDQEDVTIMGFGRLYCKRGHKVPHVPTPNGGVKGTPVAEVDIPFDSYKMIRFFPCDRFKDVVNNRVNCDKLETDEAKIERLKRETIKRHEDAKLHEQKLKEEEKERYIREESRGNRLEYLKKLREEKENKNGKK